MDDLLQKIALLKNKQVYDLEILKAHIHYSYENLKPTNIIQKTLHRMVSSTEIKKDLLKSVTNLTLNYLLNKILTNNNNNIISNVIYYASIFFRKKIELK